MLRETQISTPPIDKTAFKVAHITPDKWLPPHRIGGSAAHEYSLMINNCLRDKKLPVYGDGLQIRDWLYVGDHCAAIDAVIRDGAPGEVYNIGGNNEKANIEIVRLILSALGKSDDLIQYVQDRPGHDRRYAIDNTKISTKLGWQPSYTFEDGMRKTIGWYLDNKYWVG